MEIFNLIGKILLQDNNTKGKLEEIESAGSKTGLTLTNAFSTIGGALLKLGALVGVTMGFSSLFQKAEAGQKTMAQMSAVLKSTGDASGMTKDQLVGLADNLSKVTTFSAGTTKQAENMLLTFTNIKSSVFPQTISAAQDMATAMGMDLTSATLTLGKALNDPAQGLTRLTREGVTFTDAQKQQITAMEKAGNTAGAQAIILQELEKEFGGSAKAAGQTFAGQLTILQNQLTSVGVGIVSKLLPPLTTLVSTINQHMPQIQAVIGNVTSFIGNAIDTLTPTFEKIIQDVVKIAENIFPQLGSSGGALSSTLLNLAKGGLTAIKDVLDWIANHGAVVQAALLVIGSAFAAIKIAGLIGNIKNFVSSAKDLVNGFKTLKDAGASAGQMMRILFNINPMTLGIGIGIALLVAAVYEIITHWTQIKTFFENLWKDVTSVTSSAWNGIKNFFSGLWNWVDNFFKQWAKIPAYIGGIWNSLKSGASGAFNSLKSTISSALNGIKSVFTTILTPIVSGVINTFNKLKPGLTTIFNGVKTVISSIWLGIKTVILGPVLLILDLVTGNFSKLSSDAQGIFNNLKGALNGIWGGIKQVFIGTVQVIGTLLQTLWSGIVNTAQSLWDNFTSFMSNLWTNIKNTAINAWTSLKSSVINLVTSIVQGAINLWNSLISWFENLPGRLYNLGVSMFTSMRNGISGVISTIGSVITNGFNSAISFLESLPGKALGWGKDFIDGLIKGITGSVGAIGNAVSGIGDKIRSFLHFSVPDEGPLTDYESWMPDFVKGLANGISNSKHLITNAVTGLAGSLQVGMNLTPTLAGGTNLPTIIPDNSGNNPGLSFNIQHLTLNGYKDVKKMMRDAYNIQQDYNKGKGN